MPAGRAGTCLGVRASPSSSSFRAAWLGLVLCGAAGCAAFASRQEPLRLGNWSDLTAQQLGLAAGASSVSQAESSARALGLTGLRTDTFVGDGLLLGALSADFQTRVHLFEGDRYVQSVALRSGGTPPYGTVARLARSDEGVLLLALYLSPSDLVAGLPAGLGPRLDVFLRRAGAFDFVRTVRLDHLVAQNGGLTSPFFVGHDLSEGILFLARDRGGAVWKSAYLLSMAKGAARFEPLPLEEAARCSCVVDYLYGGG